MGEAMSRLSQLLRRATASEAPPLGFGAPAQRPRATMLVVARLSGNASRLSGRLEGADALLVEGETTAGLRKELQALEGVPWGVLLGHASAEAIAPLREAGLSPGQVLSITLSEGTLQPLALPARPVGGAEGGRIGVMNSLCNCLAGLRPGAQEEGVALGGAIAGRVHEAEEAQGDQQLPG